MTEKLFIRILRIKSTNQLCSILSVLFPSLPLLGLVQICIQSQYKLFLAHIYSRKILVKASTTSFIPSRFTSILSFPGTCSVWTYFSTVSTFVSLGTLSWLCGGVSTICSVLSSCPRMSSTLEGDYRPSPLITCDTPNQCLVETSLLFLNIFKHSRSHSKISQ